MAVYVDDMRASFGRLIMCHMVADTSAELLEMARKIGVQVKWIQYPGTAREHFDIALPKRALAVAAGAIEIKWTQCACMLYRRAYGGELGKPEDAKAWVLAHKEATA